MELPTTTSNNLRDAWEACQADLERQLSATLGGVPWTVAVDPRALFAHYVQGALHQLGRYAAEHGAEGVRRLNALARAHVLALEVAGDDADADNDANADEDRPCCRATIAAEDGRLVVRIGLNPVDALAPAQLERALAAAAAAAAAAVGASGSAAAAAAVATPVPTPAAAPTPTPPPSSEKPEFPRLPHLVPRSMSLAARTSIRNQYDIGEIHAAIAVMLHQPAAAVELEPNFLETYHALLAIKQAHRERAAVRPAWARNGPGGDGGGPGDDGGGGGAAAHWPLPFPMPVQLDAQVAAWEMRLGGLVRAYFASVAERMRTEVFAGDERLCGGFLAAVPRRRIAFRLVEAVPAGQHGDVAVENGTLYVQTTVNAFGRAVERTADRLVERLGIVPADEMFPPDAT